MTDISAVGTADSGSAVNISGTWYEPAPDSWNDYAPANPGNVMDGDHTTVSTYPDSVKGGSSVSTEYAGWWTRHFGAIYQLTSLVIDYSGYVSQGWSYLAVPPGGDPSQPDYLWTRLVEGVDYTVTHGAGPVDTITFLVTANTATADLRIGRDIGPTTGLWFVAGISALEFTIGGDAPEMCDFSASPTSGAAPLDVSFTDLSSPTPACWDWDFGDGGTSQEQNPTHTYLTAGTYTVTLTIDGGDCSRTITSYIVITEAAEAWDVYDKAAPNGPIIAVLANAYQRQFRKEDAGTGSGAFKINKNAPEARADVLQKGNIVKVRIPDLGPDYVFAFILETGDFTLVDANESGGEELTFGGRGILAYLDRAIMWDQAFTTGLDVSATWTKIWETTNVPKPSGVAYDPAESAYVYVGSEVTRRVAKVRQSDRVVVSWSPPLWTGAGNYLGGISFDPSDATILWALEAPWLSGSSGNTLIRKIRRSDWAVLATYDLGSAIQHTDIRSDGSHLWLSRYDGTTTIYKRSLTTGLVVNSYSITYKGVVQTHANGIAINGTQIAYWFGGTTGGGTGKALIADTSAPTTILSVQDTSGVAGFGGEWTTEGGNDFLYVVNFLLGDTWKYQLTSATPHDPLNGTWRLDEGTPGAILWRIIQEAQAAARPQHPLPDLTYAFTGTADSAGNLWATADGTLQFDAKVGDSVLDVVTRLMAYGLTVTMSPYLVLGGYNTATYGTDRSSATFAAGKIRLQKGVNIADTLKRRLSTNVADSHLLVGGAGSLYAEAIEDDLGYVREGFLSTSLSDPTALEGTGVAELARERVIADSEVFAILWGEDALDGLYLPLVDYFPGDTVRLHTGTGETDFNEQDQVIYAVSVVELDTNAPIQMGGKSPWKPVVELTSPFLLPPPSSSGSSSSAGTTVAGSTGAGGGVTATSIKIRDDVTGVSVSATMVAGQDHTVVETPPGTAVLGHRWPALGQLADVDDSGVVDGDTLIWVGGDGLWEAGVIPTPGDSMVPYYIGPADSFTVPLYKQALWKAAITVDAGGSLIVRGQLVGVSS